MRNKFLDTYVQKKQDQSKATNTKGVEAVDIYAEQISMHLLLI